ncbi:MAG: ectonucleotide pyrophosphatase/phosphodiesterase [Myxococcota bacterium]
MTRLLFVLALSLACRGAPPTQRPGGHGANTATTDVSDTTDQTDAPRPQDGRSLILISIDGLRWDYMDRTDTPNLDRVAAGVRAEGLQPPFPSYTFPSHYTIITGLHPENHGIVSNVFYDPVRKDQFKLGAPEDMVDGSWWLGEPLWNTAERQGIIAATLFWPGSEAAIGGQRPSEWTPYDSGMSHTSRVNNVLGWLEREDAERPGFMTLYFSAVDSAGHGHGPEHAEVDGALRGVDSALGLLLDGIEQQGLKDKVDLVVVSDHGMAPKDPEKVVLLDDAVDLSSVHVVEYSPLFQARIPDPDKAEAIRAGIDALEHVECYLAKQTPPEWHYRAHRAIGDVVCLAEGGWQLSRAQYFKDNRERFIGGTHGWDPAWKPMHGVFMASGPRFKQGQTLGTVRAVDLYGMMCDALGIEPAPNDGDPALAAQVLAR